MIANSFNPVLFNFFSFHHSAQEKASTWIRIAQLFLEDEESVEAERYINRASEVMRACADDKKLLLRYQVSFAKILDFKRQFQRAALKYYQLSLNTAVNAREQLEYALENAIKCAVLAEVGPQRARLLTTLYKDERSIKTER